MYHTVSKGSNYSLFPVLRRLDVGYPAQPNLKVAHKPYLHAAL